MAKSTLATALTARHGLRHINLDYPVNRIDVVDDPKGRACFRTLFHDALLHHVPVGHVVEGDDLVLSDRWHGSGRDHGFETTPRWLAHRTAETSG